jgi:hypothetical protein
MHSWEQPSSSYVILLPWPVLIIVFGVSCSLFVVSALDIIV